MAKILILFYPLAFLYKFFFLSVLTSSVMVKAYRNIRIKRKIEWPEKGRRRGRNGMRQSYCRCINFGALPYFTLYTYALSLVCLFLYPLACVDKRFYPWRNLIVVDAIFRIVAVLPRENGTFQVRHDCQMTSVGAGQCCNGIV